MNKRILSTLATAICSLCLACSTTVTDSWKNITKDKPIESEFEQIRIIARQSYWTIWYPGADGIFGQFDKNLVDSSNRIGLLDSGPNAKDDVVVVGPEFYLLENQNYNLSINSWDVVHGVYMPAFRIAIKAIPGMETYFPIQTKTATVAEDSSTSRNMLICTQVCGIGHPNMKMKFKIANEKDYWKWLDSIQ